MREREGERGRDEWGGGREREQFGCKDEKKKPMVFRINCILCVRVFVCSGLRWREALSVWVLVCMCWMFVYVYVCWCAFVWIGCFIMCAD